jgi:cell division transport system ATP-binding protein
MLGESKPLIKFEKVIKKFGDIDALCNISFEIEQGEFVFITGPSGAGKTTIIKLLLKEYLPTSGKIWVDNEDLESIKTKNIPGYRQKIGVVFQDFKLLTDRTIFENVALPLEFGKMPKIEIEKYVEEVLELVDLTKRTHLFPAQLAGGEIQRACLARAIVANPKILIADEPTGNLDPSTSWQIVKLIKKINKLGTTVLMATHNMEIVDSMKERVIKLNKGQIIKDQKGGKYEPI